MLWMNYPSSLLEFFSHYWEPKNIIFPLRGQKIWPNKSIDIHYGSMSALVVEKNPTSLAWHSLLKLLILQKNAHFSPSFLVSPKSQSLMVLRSGANTRMFSSLISLCTSCLEWRNSRAELSWRATWKCNNVKVPVNNKNTIYIIPCWITFIYIICNF